MFRMQIEDVLKVGDIVSVAGPCENRHDYRGKLKDDSGNMYETYVPLGKPLVIDDNLIMICLKGSMDKNSLKGLVLHGV